MNDLNGPYNFDEEIIPIEIISYADVVKDPYLDRPPRKLFSF